jgi:hypothetical protein
VPLDNESLAKIRRIHAAYAAKVKLVQADRNLSEYGKQKALAVLHHTHQAQIQGIAESAEATYRQAMTTLERKMFGVHDIGANDINAAISYRDAQDRVAQIKTPAEAQLMLRRADRSGDKLLARALFDRAWEASGEVLASSGWGEVVNDYVQTFRPDLAADVQELANLQQLNSRRHRMNEQIETSLFQPPELARMSPGDRRQAIAEATTAGLQPGGGTSSDPTPGEEFARMVRETSEGVNGA